MGRLGSVTERQNRRVVTVLFADLVGSTGIGESLDPEALRVLQSRYFESARTVIERHGGTVEKYIGDAVMAVFGWPTTHEDDALRAVRAAVGIRAAVGELRIGRAGSARLQLRIGVQTGPVVATVPEQAGRALVTGDTVNTAARLQSSAAPGEILIGRLTRELVRDAVTTEALRLSLRGKSEQVDAHRLLDVVGDAAHARRLDTPLVGREPELEVLLAAFDTAVAERTCQLVTVVAPAGVGKSRLLTELASLLTERATVLRGHCLPYGDGITYWAVAEVLRAAVGARDDAIPVEVAAALRERVADLPESARMGEVLAAVVGASEVAASTDDIAWATRRFLESIARDRPLALLVEDLHWAEPALLDLIETLVDWSQAAALLIVATARLELRERRPEWATGRPTARVLDLRPMGAGAVERLLDGLPGGAALPVEVRARIATAAEGNPLFVEEMVGKLIDDGALRLEADSWRTSTSIGDVAVPSSISALLAARIDGLPAPERVVAERGAVVGRSFERGAVAALSPADDRGGLVARLLALSRREIIARDAPGLGDDDAFRFRHILIRDAAYERLAKRDRAELHERFVDWLESVAGERLTELAEIRAHHLAWAAEYRLELGQDLGGSPLLERAHSALLAAADRAEQLHAYPVAARLLARLIGLEEGAAGDVGEAPGAQAAAFLRSRDLRLREAEARYLSGDTDGALALAEPLLRAAEDAGDPESQAGILERIGPYCWGKGDVEGALAALERAAALLGPGSSAALRARILAGLARFLMLRLRDRDAEPLARRAIAAARSGHLDREEAGATITLGTCVARLGAPEEGLALLREGLAIARRAADGYELLRAYTNMVIVASLTGDIELCRSLCREAVEVAAEYGLSRSDANVVNATNGALGEAAFGTREGMAWFVERAVALGFTGWNGSMVQEAVARLKRIQGDWEGVTRAVSDARAQVRGGSGQAMRSWLDLDLRLVEASSHLSQGRADRAERVLDGARALVDPSESEQIVELETLALEAASERAVQARRSGDLEAAHVAAADAERLAVTCGGLAAAAAKAGSAPFSWLARGPLLLVDGELQRARGQADPACWRVAAEAAERMGIRRTAAHARMRLVEALIEAGSAAREVEEALHAAEAVAIEHGDAAILARLAVLRARATAQSAAESSASVEG
jgi:class 3 adenylate cyclase/tetratricopeptide (TPR) repeat protein